MYQYSTGNAFSFTVFCTIFRVRVTSEGEYVKKILDLREFSYYIYNYHYRSLLFGWNCSIIKSLQVMMQNEALSRGVQRYC